MDFNNFVYTFLTSLASIGVLFLLTKLMGNRQMSQLSLFDYINGITIGSIAAEMATASKDGWMQPCLAMIVYAAVVLGISVISNKSIVLRRIFVGRALLLYEDGKLYERNFRKGRLDLNEFLTECRNGGYYDITQLHTCVLEANGKISFLQKTYNKPVTPSDLELKMKKEERIANVIIDGNVMTENIKGINKDIQWLEEELKKKDKSLEDIFLGICTEDGRLTLYEKNKDDKNDIWV